MRHPAGIPPLAGGFCGLQCLGHTVTVADGDLDCGETATKKNGTKRGHEEIENDAPEQMGTCHSAENAVLDETSSLEVDGGSQTTKRPKLNMIPLSDYELQRHERIRQNKRRAAYRTFVVGALAHPCSEPVRVTDVPHLL